VLAYALDRLTSRVQNVWVANVHPRQQALQRVLANNVRTGKLRGIERSGPPSKGF